MRLSEIGFIDSLKSELGFDDNKSYPDPSILPQEIYKRPKHDKYHPVMSTSKKKKSHVVTPAGSTMEELVDIVERFENVKSLTKEEKREAMLLIRKLIVKVQQS